MLKFSCSLLKLYLCGLFLFLSSGGCTHRKKPDFAWPVKPPYNLSRKYSIYHTGIDFPKRTGEDTLATASGRAIYAGAGFSGYGKMIILEHQHNWASLYAHLSKIDVTPGQHVHKGQKIGEVGNTGRSSGPHLHFEIMYKKQPLNPLSVLP